MRLAPSQATDKGGWLLEALSRQARPTTTRKGDLTESIGRDVLVAEKGYNANSIADALLRP